eukprot:COSAG05_NODE_2666_length_2784_cov_2.315829_2_plen_55_part_00
MGAGTAADVDNFAKLAFGPRMSVTGLIEQKDLSGASERATHSPVRAVLVRGGVC